VPLGVTGTLSVAASNRSNVNRETLPISKVPLAAAAQYGYEFVRIRNAAEKLSQCVQSLTISAKAGWSSGCVPALDPRRVEQIWIGDAHRDDGKVAEHEHRGHFKEW
jgi:hypothetical protein